VPLVRGARGFRSKEKTFITAINYEDIVGQARGQTSSVVQAKVQASGAHHLGASDG
jgi:hypothetical protein